MTTWTMDRIKAANKAAGSYWFSPDTLRFFKSRFADDVREVNGLVYFISSERYSMDHPRLYTVRVFNPATPREVDTHGEFQAYASLNAARRALLRVGTDRDPVNQAAPTPIG